MYNVQPGRGEFWLILNFQFYIQGEEIILMRMRNEGSTEAHKEF